MASILPAHGTCAKPMGEVFVLHPVLNKNLSRFLKFHLRLPAIAFGKRLVKTLRKWFFWGKVVIPDPPEVVSGLGGGGSAGLWS
jgi:hypothetical protein